MAAFIVYAQNACMMRILPYSVFVVKLRKEFIAFGEAVAKGE